MSESRVFRHIQSQCSDYYALGILGLIEAFALALVISSIKSSIFRRFLDTRLIEYLFQPIIIIQIFK